MLTHDMVNYPKQITNKQCGKIKQDEHGGFIFVYHNTHTVFIREYVLVQGPLLHAGLFLSSSLAIHMKW